MHLNLSPPQRLLLVNTRERNGSGSAGERKRECGGRLRSLRALIFPLPSLRAPRVLFSQGATVGGLCGGESILILLCELIQITLTETFLFTLSSSKQVFLALPVTFKSGTI